MKPYAALRRQQIARVSALRRQGYVPPQDDLAAL